MIVTGPSFQAFAHARWATQEKILIVDDVPASAELLFALLRQEGYRNLRIASDGVEAMRMVSEEKPDLILLDLLMPNMDGYEFCQRLRETYTHQDIVVLVQTVLTDASSRAKAFAIGATDFVTKPINAMELVARVGIHLENKSLHEKAKATIEQTQKEFLSAETMRRAFLPSDDMLALLKDCYPLMIEQEYRGQNSDVWQVIPVNPMQSLFYFSANAGDDLKSFLLQNKIYQKIIGRLQEQDLSLQGLVYDLNKFCVAQNRTMPFFVGIIDFATDQCTYVNAGLPSSLFAKNRTATPKILAETGAILGQKKDAVFKEGILPLESGSRFLMCSPALVHVMRSEDWRRANWQDVFKARVANMNDGCYLALMNGS